MSNSAKLRKWLFPGWVKGSHKNKDRSLPRYSRGTLAPQCQFSTGMQVLHSFMRDYRITVIHERFCRGRHRTREKAQVPQWNNCNTLQNFSGGRPVILHQRRERLGQRARNNTATSMTCLELSSIKHEEWNMKLLDLGAQWLQCRKSECIAQHLWKWRPQE